MKEIRLPISLHRFARSGTGLARFIPAGLLLLLIAATKLAAQPADYDFGDAPDPSYPTLLASNGARHLIVPTMFLGLLIDSEPDGQPHPNALGDDLAALPDEDGVVFTTPLVAGQPATVQVVASAPGFLSAWIDFGADGSWAQPGDQIFAAQPLSPGTNVLGFTVPPMAAVGMTSFARFRFSSLQNLSYIGAAPDGEVEDYQIMIQEEEMNLDYGDAPDQPYPTLRASNGARHVVVPGRFMGTLIDSEVDGQPNAIATGDDIANLADEDGVQFMTPLIPGQQATVTVTVSLPGMLNAWIDFNADGSWAQPGDQIFINQAVIPGPNTLNFGVPTTATPGAQTFARFRYDSVGNLSYTGLANDGEVEDYRVTIQDLQVPLDFGDAPDQPYPTFLASNGARHMIAPGMFLGALIDSEPNGQPNATATGDDLANLADEDGVQFVGWLIPGLNSTVIVTASLPGRLDAWIDFNADGSWAQPGDQIFASQPLVPGPNILSFPVPPNPNWGFSTIARFRYSTAGGLSFTGLAIDGEVEDYQVKIEQFPQHDLGDAPDSSNHAGLPMSAYPAAGVQAFFPTVFTPLELRLYGPIHMQPKAIAFLGQGVSLEWEADTLADEDMVNNILPLMNQPDQDAKDDGVVFPLVLPHCTPTTLQYVVNVNAPTNTVFFVNVWFDWNRDGDWNDAINCPSGQNANEWAVQNDPVNVLLSGPFPLQLTNTTTPFVAWHPLGAKQPVWMRITLSEQPWPPPGGASPVGGEGPFNGYSFGETEDYYVEDYEADETFDFGDAPDPSYPTLLASNGARHLIVPTMFLGLLIDSEPDGQPHPNALGDDLAALPDEDGVVFTTPLVAGQPATVQVVASAPGFLSAWIDFGADGSWAQPGDQIFAAQPLSPGTNVLGFTVPPMAAVGMTSFARFRFSSLQNLSYIGAAPDGEVEDYQIMIQEEEMNLDYGDAPDQPYPTLRASNGARHVVVPGRFMGTLIDSEVDGQPNAIATGDDIANLADEDGVQFMTPLIPGQQATVTVTVSLPGMLNAWIDFNADGSWAQPGDQIFINQAVIPGPNTLNFGVPTTATPGAQTFARFRYDSVGNLSYTGLANDGEVEDYRVTIQDLQAPLDFGDAPDQPYPTFLASNGARHMIAPGMFLGALIDSEPNGQPNATATGDDLANLADEDGVQFVGWLIPGLNSTVIVTASLPGRLDAWIDFNADGSWAQPGDQIFASQPLVPGPNILSFPVPPNPNWGFSTIARFRYSTAGGLSFTGLAIDGEVEDYQVKIEQFPQHDLGDAPDSSNHAGLPMSAYPAAGVQAFFPTVFTPLSTPPYGPIHMQPKAIAFLGQGVSLEWEADTLADEDMVNNILPLMNQPDQDAKDDGVVFPLVLPHCTPTTLQYVVNVNAPTNTVFFVNVWFDWNRDGDWNDAINCPSGQNANEWAVQNDPVNVLLSGPFPLQLTNTTTPFVAWHPLGAKQPVWMRITLSEQPWPPPGGASPVGGEGPFNGYSFGETEDYYVEDYEADETFDFGDAPDPSYPTLLASNGARHLIVPSFLLGALEDAEMDGQPDPVATGDDTNNVADEDGIVFTTPVLLGTQACVKVLLQSGSAGGLLDAWLDFNSDGAWSAGDQIFASQPLVPGLNSGLCFAVPASAKLGPTFARFRLSSVGGLTPTGPAPDGEVEDYLVTIRQPWPATSIVITNITVTNFMVGTNIGQAVSVQWTSETNIYYQLQAVTNLNGAPTNLFWTKVGGEVLGPANTQSETNSPPGSQRYYRVLAPFTWP